MKTEYTWVTHFVTAENIMIHTFSDRVKVTSDLKTGLVKVFKDGEIVNTIDNPTLNDYERLLVNVAKDASELEKFNGEK